jgi:peptidylprolyl isomerase domain and WD repeat-containing protein 1
MSLGKRERSGELKTSESTDDEGGPKPQPSIEEEEDDDVGPMPMPNNGSAPRKKRKGM